MSKIRTFSFLATIPFFVLTSCTPDSPSANLPPGSYAGTDISPTGEVKLGEVYRSSVPLTNANTPEIGEICPDDFAMTRDLVAIKSKYSGQQGVSKPDELRSATNAKGIGVTGIEVSWLTVGGNYKPKTTTAAEYKGVTYYSMTPSDVDTVWTSLGANCKANILKYRKQGYGVYIPIAAYKADTVNIKTTTDGGYDATATLKLGKVKPGFTISDTNTSSVTVSGKNFFYKVVPSN